MKKESFKEAKLNAGKAKRYLKSLPKRKNIKRNLPAGTMFLFTYNAKDKSVAWDRTPCCIMLTRNRKHTLGVNLHWCPMYMRNELIDFLYAQNEARMKRGWNPRLEYKELKKFLVGKKYFPIIRKYINRRMSRKCIIVEPTHLKIAAKYSNEDFQIPKADALYKKAVFDYNAKKRKRRRK